MEASTVIIPTQLAYMHIPAKELRSFVDGVFPNLAKNSTADVTSGFGHRYVAGHDLLLDVPRTVAEQGSINGLKHAGHIVLTDFATKAGIPIPGFSHSGLGYFLEQAGIHRGWLQVNLCDTGLGIIAISDGSSHLIQAIHGSLLMSGATFFDTFVTGGLEVGFSMVTQNPILLAGGVENIAAGLVATLNTYSIFVDPLVFFGSAGTSAIVGFSLAYGLSDSSLSKAALDGIRSGTVGALFTLSPAFGFGALAGFVSYKLGGKLAEIHNADMQALLTIDEIAYKRLLKELCDGNTYLSDFLNRAEPHVEFMEISNTLPSKCRLLEIETPLLCEKVTTLNSDVITLSTTMKEIKSDSFVLADDAKVLFNWYHTNLVV